MDGITVSPDQKKKQEITVFHKIKKLEKNLLLRLAKSQMNKESGSDGFGYDWDWASFIASTHYILRSSLIPPPLYNRLRKMKDRGKKILLFIYLFWEQNFLVLTFELENAFSVNISIGSQTYSTIH